ncbi:MAG: metallophosphoesterase family protein [Spirochaetes bacterium]|jgi:serine/threonine protein phosphatase 1|nr:metallophosphoesterase family protein [Spirochaetota bacterium]
MYYLIGDIHGEFFKLLQLIKKIEFDFKPESDELIFLGDYIDRGIDSFKVVELLHSLSLKYKTTFIMGNHEQMLYDMIYNNEPSEIYYQNGGQTTYDSYMANTGSFVIPQHHKKILFSGIHYVEREEFIAVHAGINPNYESPDLCDEFDLMWIRKEFFAVTKKWNKTVIFGHTPTFFITKERNTPYIDENKNIIGIDTGAVYYGYLTALRMPDRKFYQAG